MMAWGDRLRVTLFGTSHGPEVGVSIEGLPAGLRVDLAAVQAALDRRRPLGRRLASRRAEADELVVDSGLADGHSDGGTLRAHVANRDVQRAAYAGLRDTPRPGHADYPARVRFGADADLSGGGIFSGRMTVGLVIAGAVVRGLLEPAGIDVAAYTQAVGSIVAPAPVDAPLPELRRRSGENEVGAFDPLRASAMAEAIAEARRAGDSLGGVVECRATGVPVGLGEPFFDSIESVVAHLLFSVPAVKAEELGDGFALARMRGSQANDAFFFQDRTVRTRSNHAGGILGGLADGATIVVRAGIKPTSSIALAQETVNLRTGQAAEIVVGGRHDPCIVPRAVVVVESVVALALAELGVRGGFVG